MHTLAVRRPIAPIALAAALLTAFFVLFAWPQSAAAHDTLVDSTPAADSRVDALPSELTLTFSAAPITGDGSTEIVVTDSDGDDVADGPAEVDGALVTQPLSEGDAGEYRVLWKIVSSDGHPTSGEFAFTVTGDAAPQTPTAEPTTDPTVEPTASAPAEPSPSATTLPGTGTPADGDSFARNLPWIIGGVIVVAGLGALVAVLVARSRRADSAPNEPDDDESDTGSGGRSER